MRQVKIAPSILAADFSCLGSEIIAITEAKADWIHFDIMDGHFVPNLTIGPDILKSVKPLTPLPFDVHLMIYKPEFFIETFIEAGADIITLHQEATPHLHRQIQLVKSLGAKIGISLNPATPLSQIYPILDEIDLVLIMSVNPGFGGQTFIASQLQKIEDLALIVKKNNLNIEIQVDGGITIETAKSVIQKGATCLVSGTSIFKDPLKDYASCISALRTPKYE